MARNFRVSDERFVTKMWWPLVGALSVLEQAADKVAAGAKSKCQVPLEPV